MTVKLFSSFLRRNKFAKRQRAKPHPKRPSYFLEQLEPRLLLSADLIGIPDWLDQGPGPENQGGAVAAPNNAVNGAVEVLLEHPTIANMAFAGSVAGGVWRTNDLTGGGNPALIDWQPLTDKLPSLYVGAMAFDPSNPNTLYVGTGSYSNTFRNQLGEMSIGLYVTTNANATAADVTWQNLGASTFANLPIRSIEVSPTDPNLLLVAADDGSGNGGLFRSLNGGGIWTELSGAGVLSFGGGASDIVRDQNRNNTYYAAAPGAGVFRTDDSGDNWVRIDNLNTAIAGIVGSSNIELALHDAGALTVAYVGVVGGGPALTGVFRYAEDGADGNGTGGVDDATESTWAIIGAAPAIHGGNQGFNNFSIVADPVNANLVYVGGDRPPDIFRGNAGDGSWTDIGAAAVGTRPHADSRSLVFIDNTTLVETDDGGIFRLTNPAAPGGADDWVSLNANLRAIEFHSVTYDTADNLIVGGSQDNGSAVQTAVGSQTWDMFQGGDGSTQAYSVPGDIRYALGNNFGGTFSRNGVQLELQPNGGGANLAGLENTSGAGSDFLFATNPGFQSRLPVDANRFNANDMMFGRRGLYESTDQGVTITTVINPGDFSKPVTERFNSLVYGGMRDGSNFANVFWAGTEGGRIYLRDQTGTIIDRTAALTAAIAGTAAIHDIAIDPADYRIAYVLKGDAVAVTTDAGVNWTAITDNIGSLTTELRSIALVDDSPATAGDGIVVAGGLGGVFRRLPAAGLGSQTWSEFGLMPNSLVHDLDFVAVDTDGNAADGTGILLAGTFGRGAWTISDVSAVIDTIGVLQIFGDEDFFGQDDTIRLVRDTSFSNLLDVFINSTAPVLTVEMSLLSQINVFSLGGNDTLIIDSTNGLINVVNGIRYDGDGGSDSLRLEQTGGPQRVSDTYSVGLALGSGVSTIVGGGAAGTQTVLFENLSPVLDLVAAALLTVNATAADNAINYSVGALVTTGLVTVDEHEAITFANKTALTIDAGAGQDTINLNNPNTPTGLTSITVNGGDPAGGDALIVTGAGVAVSVNTATAAISGASGAGGAVSIGYSGIETLSLLAGIGDLAITATAADDIVTVTPGVSTGANSGTVQSSGAVPQIAFVNSGTFTANLGGGNDALIVNGSSNADIAAVNGAAVAITGRRTVNYTGIEALTVNGNAGSDTFDVTPAAGVAIFIDGGDPVGALPGDLLNIIAGGGTVTYNAGPETDEGSFGVGANQPVSFDHIESFGITGGGPAVINGTNGPDAITVIARDASTHAAANGVQDFTVSVNTGPELLFVNVSSLTVNALSGSDQVTLRTPAPNNAVWEVNVTVNGGPPAADTDRLIVETPGAGAETAVYTPTAFDGGTLDLVSLSSLVTINTIEVLIYDGQGDNDSLTIVGTGGDDTIVHTPGAGDQAGSFLVNSLLALSYQNLGGGGSLTANGAGGTDTLVYNGTVGDDIFTISSTWQVNLNSRLVVNTADVEVLSLVGLAGIDRVNLVGTGGNDDIIINGQTILLGGKAINTSGIEDIRLDALGGTSDRITYNGVSGVTENITVSASGIAGSGQISVPGITLVNFSNVERIVVNGNAPTATETDTLTFVGTEAVDIFNINLAAAGTEGDPVLRLQNSLAASLLTLENYTNFNTLRVLGLDGADTFNVTVAATGPNRNLFVDGGQPAGKKRSTDNLNIIYTAPRPRIIHSAATQDPDAGIVDLNYGTARYVVGYDGIEQVVIRRA